MKYDKMIEARRLRQEDGLPINEIATRLEVSKSSVSNWVRSIELSEDQKQSLLEKNPVYNRQIEGSQKAKTISLDRRKEFQDKGVQKAKEKAWLHTVGCMLYWAEGSKKRNCLVFSNSDPDMMRLFLRFLIEEMKVDKEEIALSINVHLGNNLNLAEIEKKWIETLDLPVECLRKSTISQLPRMSSGKKKNKLPLGVARLTVCKTELVQHIYGAIQEFAGFKNPKWIE